VTDAGLGKAIAAARAGGVADRWPTKMRVRDRLERLLDPASLTEDGLLANARGGPAADGVITGVGTVAGRPVAVIAHDFTVKAGSRGQLTCEKQIRILERADRDLLPVFYLVDSAGGRLTDQMGFFPGRRGAARIFHLQWLSGRVPQLCCLFGPSAAGGAYMPAFTDWVGMVEGTRRCISPRRASPRRSPGRKPPWRRWAAPGCTPPSPGARTRSSPMTPRCSGQPGGSSATCLRPGSSARRRRLRWRRRI
jgi:hypothetical protein